MNAFNMNFCKRYDFPIEYIENIDNQLQNNALFKDLVKRYYETPQNSDIWDEVHDLAESINVNKYTLDFFVLLYCMEPLYNKYRKNGLSEELFYNTMEDIKYKTKECLDVYGVFGVFCAWWYFHFLELNLFKFGRLEFERIKFPSDYEDENIKIKKGEYAVTTHIPSCGKLLVSDCEDSFKQAAKFFGKETDKDYVLFVCHSWLLFKKHKEMLGENSNIVKFTNMFKIIADYEEDEFENNWRIYGKDFEKPLKELPEDTAIQRGYKKLLLNGAKSGNALGIRIELK